MRREAVTPAGSRPYLTEDQAAELIAVARKTLRAWRHLRKGPPWTRAGHKILYLRSDIDAWIASNRTVPADHVDAAAGALFRRITGGAP